MKASKTKPKSKPAPTKTAKKPPAIKTTKRRVKMSTEKHPEPKSAPKEAKTHNTADDLKTEQEKGGKDPISKSEPSPGPVKTIEEEGIQARDPYPEGNPPKIERYPDGTIKKPDAAA